MVYLGKELSIIYFASLLIEGIVCGVLALTFCYFNFYVEMLLALGLMFWRLDASAKVHKKTV